MRVPGEEKAWEELAALDPGDVCRRSGARYRSEEGRYLLRSFGAEFFVDVRKKEIAAATSAGEPLLGRFAYFSRISILWYLVKSVETAPAGRHVKPGDLPGGDIFFRGSHVLPLPAVAHKYSTDREGFLERCGELGGVPVAYGDAAGELMAFPRVPVTLILWMADEEWEARCDLLFDSTAQVQLPIDILWSVAMMAVLLFL